MHFFQTKPFALVSAIIGAVSMSFMIVFAAFGWGVDFVYLLSSFYFGFSVSFFGSLFGIFWGFLSGYILGYLFSFFYNLFT